MASSESEINLDEPRCQYFVVRKKRLCRMTVRPGRQYCGEHEPQPRTEDGNTDERVPCPNDPKHTCYFSKLERHLLKCNARQGELPAYIVHNINAPAAEVECPRKPLSVIPKDTLLQVIDKVNALYDKHVEGNIWNAPERAIHSAVRAHFEEGERTESSRRHLRQASRLLWLAEEEGLVQDGTCYVELGAGKGQMSYFAGVAWCAGAGGSRVVVVDRASVRHKRDNRLGACSERVRADLRHVRLARLGAACSAPRLVGLAKHLCGVATDYALRCLTSDEVVDKCRGAVLATCCHHRCERAAYIASAHLLELGINGDEFNAMLGIVSWATCGDGCSRERRKQTDSHSHNGSQPTTHGDTSGDVTQDDPELTTEQIIPNAIFSSKDQAHLEKGETGSEQDAGTARLSREYREQVGRRAKALLDWGRVLRLREQGFDAGLCHFVPSSVSLENVCIVAKKVTDISL